MTSLHALCRIPIRSSQIPLTQHICDVEISFLQKLSTLEFLDFSLAEVSFSNTEQYPCCPLPHLNSYGGFASLMPCFIPGSTVRNVLIICPTLPNPMDWIHGVFVAVSHPSSLFQCFSIWVPNWHDPHDPQLSPRPLWTISCTKGPQGTGMWIFLLYHMLTIQHIYLN